MSRLILPLLCFIAAAAAAADAPPAAPPAPAAAPKPRVTYSAEQLVGLMDDAELTFYYDTFDYVMEKVKPNETFPWKTYASNGEITPAGPFAGKGTVCRSFREVVNVKNQHGAVYEGTGCKRVGADGWCKLRKNDVLSCALEPPRSLVDRTARDAGDTVKSVTNKASSWWPF
ncbi:MAG: hypothetical protein JO089_00955 [Alphaproteobacteria bacterium]|nr:hypothetical protein [Alphaproteobacteria bacterium]